MPSNSVRPPGPKQHWLSGHLPEFRRDRLSFLTQCARQYGDVVSVRLGPIKIYALNHPDLVEEVLVAKNRIFIKHFALRQARPSLGNGLLTSEGDFWRRQRKLAQPAFHKDRVASYAHTMVEHTNRMLATWNDGDTINLQDAMMRLTLGIVAKCLFDADVTGDAADASAAMDTVTHAFTDRVNRLIPIPNWIPTRSNREFNAAKLALERILYRIIADRRASAEDRGDLLSMLLSAVDEDDGSRMTDRQLRDEVMTLFMAGHETTANTLIWAFKLLAENPVAEQRLHAEIDSVLVDRLPTLDDLARLPFADHVITETLRIFPTVWLLGREATEPTEIAGYHLPKGHTVWMSQWVIQRDPRFFDDPEVFRPERWDNGLAKRLPRYAYFPFGGGPRVCIGNSFAQMEAVLLLATIARDYRIRLAPGATIRAIPTITLRPDGGVPVLLGSRRDLRKIP